MVATGAAPGRRTSVRLLAATRTFWTRPQPWLLAAALVVAVSARAVAGGPSRSDLYVIGGYLAVFPFVEWVVHTSLLHWRPRRVAGRTIDPLVARKHREHHADPQRLELIFVPVPAMLTVAGSLALFAWLVPAAGRPLALTWVVTVIAVGAVYEWIHYLVHTDYRPRTRLYRALWRHHRLHHYKSEHYWFTVTTAGTADRVLRTEPDPAQVPTSPTARDLLGTGA